MGGSINVVDVVPTNLIPNYNSVENIITPQSDLLIKANFQKQKYNVNFTSSLGGKLNQEISSLTEYGTEIQINAQPDEHYKFAGWDGLNSSTYSDSNISLIITESIEATAIFEPIEYNLNLTSNLDAQTSIFISPVKPYYFGSSVKIEALPIAHYNFTSWTGSISSPSPTIEISIGGNTSLHANYEQKIYNLNIVPLVENYLGSATEVFNYSFGTISKGVSSTFNSIFELEASPSIRFEFLYWKNNEGSIISNQQSLTYKISKSEKIFGIFREKSSPALISIKPQNSGEILLNGNKFNFENNNSFPYGIAQEFSPLPQPGYTFVHWEINNNVSTNSTITYDGSEPLFLNALYEPLPFPLEIVVYPDGAGNVLTQNSKTSFLNDSTVDLTAVANPGYTFSYWNGNVSNPNNIKTSIVMKQGIKVYAHFAETAVNATATIKTLGIDGQPSDSTEGGYVNIASSYRIGTSPTVSAFPFDGYEFLHWEDEDNNIFSTSLIATVPTLTKDLKISAVFQVKSYEINFFVSPLAGGHIFVQGTKVVGSHMAKIAHNEYLLITAVANPGYTFKEWDSEDGIIDLPKISSATVKINSKAKITANFEANDKLNLTILSKPLGAGWFFGQGTHAPNSSHPLFAKARKGYEFVKWEGNPSIENTLTPSTNFNFIEDTSITAIFKVIEIELPVENYAPPGIFMVDLSVNDSDAGIVIGSGVYGTGWVDISCEAKEGFIFRYWNNDIVEDKYSAQTKVFLSKDTFVTAYFDKLGDDATIPQSVVPNSLYLGSDWWSSNWFGNYWRKTNDHWVLHSKMGWIYLIPYSNDSIWLWTDKMKDWLWTNKSVYPYFLSGSNSRWFWFDKESSTPNRQLFFEYYDPEGNGKWNVYE
jgi:predicted nucleic acid-binding protein